MQARGDPQRGTGKFLVSLDMETRTPDEGGGLLPSRPPGIRFADGVSGEFGKSAIT